MTMLEEKLFYDLTLPTSLTGSAIRFSQATDPNPKTGVQQIMEMISGNPYITWTGVGSGTPDFPFATKDLETLITMLVAARTANNANGYLLADFTGDADVGYQKMYAGSTRYPAASTVHDIHRYMDPMVYVQGFQANQDGDVSARV